jgi:DNA-binding PadR family transcriptional regulator
MSVLDLYILAMIEQGFETPYALHRNAKISLGASNPALKRLRKARLIVMEAESTSSNRPRHHYLLTSAGKRALDVAAKQSFETGTVVDVDAALRAVVLAVMFNKPEKARDILLEGAAARFSLAATRRLESKMAAVQLKSFGEMGPLKAFIETFRYAAEAQAFRELARSLKSAPKPKRPVPRRKTVASTKG